ncbi:DUF6934 family protein [Parasediminibacterium sp. JCM 36343]|uniref:DUF6934 family protein n=1 Tax=Parasediminibacterium sp. JCM 36343 TaxID=3374279 RepID=UPI00397E8D91
MVLDRYEITAGQNLTTFEFLSEGRKGRILKIIQFQQMNLNNLYNLAFGDKNLITGEIDDKVVTDNGDSEKVLATVVSAIYAFADHYPDSWIYATGRTASRTRLYRMGINKYYETVVADFEIMGEYRNEWESYEFGKDYQAFAIHRKNTKFEI